MSLDGMTYQKGWSLRMFKHPLVTPPGSTAPAPSANHWLRYFRASLPLPSRFNRSNIPSQHLQFPTNPPHVVRESSQMMLLTTHSISQSVDRTDEAIQFIFPRIVPLYERFEINYTCSIQVAYLGRSSSSSGNFLRVSFYLRLLATSDMI